MHQVTRCYDCPLCAESAFCNHPQRPKNVSIWGDNDPDETAPEWCPLRKGELLITLRVKAP